MMTPLLRSTLISIALLPFAASAQITVDNTQSPANLVQDVLLGGGVTVSNITFNGLPGGSIDPQAASFNSSTANVGMVSGLMLATGDATLAYGPNTLGGATQGGFTGNSDVDLMSIAGGVGVNDAAVLEFDFVPTGGSISFNFVFASEEYLEFVNLGFNDVFGFFLSGPGINGPFTNGAENIALVPGSSTPVTIDNVNNFNNPAYYVDNGDGFSAPYNSSVDFVQYDGLTVPLVASHSVQCGQTYHIKLAIGDVNDESYDSAVFLQAGAFSSTPATLNMTADLSLPCLATGDVQVLELVGGSAPYNVTWTSNGNALGSGMSAPVVANGSDWYVATVVDACGAITIDSVNVSSVPPQMDVPATLDIACGGQGTLAMTLEQTGPAEYVYSWTINDSLLGSDIDIAVPPMTSPTWFIAAVSDACGATVTDSTLVTGTIEPIIITVSPDVVLPCDGTGATLSVMSVSGGTNDLGDLGFLWTNGSGELGTDQQLSVDNSVAEYTVVATDGCGATATATVSVTGQQYDAIIVTLTADTSVTCAGQSAGSSALDITGGTGVFTLVWSDEAGTAITSEDAFMAEVNGTQVYTLTATDDCGHSGSAQVTLSIAPHEPLTLDLEDAMVCEGGSRELVAVATGGAGSFSYSWPTFSDTDSALVVSPESPTNFTATVTDLCGEVANATAHVGIEHPVATILTESTGYNEFAFTAQGFPAAVQFNWIFGDGTGSDEAHPEHAYADMRPTIAMVTTLTANGCLATDTIALTPAAQLFFPNAFTPDGDGFNDTFGATGLLLSEFELTIFDRWGAQVATVAGVGAAWDGRMRNGQLAPDGVYVFSFRATGERLQETNGLGHVTLLGDGAAAN